MAVTKGMPSNKCVFKASAGKVLNTFAALWLKEHCTEISYRDTAWKNTGTAGETEKWCIDRAKLQKQLMWEEEQKIRDYIDGISENGTITETVTI